MQLLQNDKKTIIGTLNPISSVSKRKINGFNYLEMEHALSGLGTVIKTEQYINAPTPKGMQLFKILKIDTVNEETLRITAMHRMYDLTNNYVKDTNIVGKDRVQAIKQVLDNTMNPHTFTVEGSSTPTDNLRIVGYTPFFALMGNKDNTVINRFSGEFDFDNDKIIVEDEIGRDNGYLIMYNKNMIELNESEDFTGVITKMIPRSRDGIYLDELYVDSTFINAYEEIYVKEIEFDISVSDDEENPKTEAQVKAELKKLAREYYLEQKCDIPRISYIIPIEDVKNKPKYEEIKFLYDLDLGDYVTVRKNSGVKIKIRLKEYVYDNIKEEFILVTLNNTEDKYSLTTQDIIANVSNKINLEIENIRANSIDVTDLTAINATINNLTVKVATIDSLLAGNITGENIQAGGITSDKLTIANGFITNAMIMNLDVSKINAGTINTNKFIIKSDDGGIEIVGATQQFKDKNNKVRIQMGKDVQGNFNFILRGEDGTTALIDHTGIKKDAIADDLIVKDMIAGDAVGEKQIDYNSFSEGFNKDTNTTTIKGTKIKLDNQNQTLDIAFNQLKTQADGTKTQTESNSTTIGIQQGQITTAINNTTIVKDGQTILLKDDYNRTVTTVDSMKSTIGTHTSQIDAVTGKVTGVENKVNIVERDLNGTISTVTSNTSSINGLNSSVTSHTNQISQLQGQMSFKVEQTDITNAVNNINVGGRNTYSKNTPLSSYDGGVIQTSGTLGGFPITNGFGITGKNGPTVMLRISNVITGNGEWTISFDAISNGEFNLVIDTCDLGASTYRVKTTTTKIVHTVNVTNYSKDVYNFIDLNNIPWIYLVCSNVKVEKGNKATDWTPSLEDVSGEVDTKINSAKAEIKMTTDSINFEVSKKTDKTSIISSINQTAEAIKISASKLELNGYVTITNLSTPGQTIIDGGNIRTGSIEAIQIKACHFSGKNMVYIEDGGILSCDGHAYLKNLFIPETHPGWLPGTIGSFSCAPTAWFDRDVQVANEIYTRGTGVVRRQVGVFIQVDALGIQNTNDKNWLLVNGYQSPHAFGVDLWMSDKNLKEDIYEVNTNKRLRTNSLIGLDLITKLQHYSYNYKKSLNTINGYSDCGYISQQLEALNKNLIIDVKQADGTVLKQPVASAIIPQLSLAIQQQQEIIQRQQDEINRIKEQLLLM